MTEYTNRLVTRALNVLDVLLSASRSLLLTEIATAASLDRATSYRLLHVLVEQGYAHREASSKRYSMNPAFYFRQKSGLPAPTSRIARPALRQLHAETTAEVSIASFQGAEIHYNREFVGGHQKGEGLFRGVLPSHATASGKVMLAFRPETEVHKIYEFMPLTAYTPRTIHDLGALEHHLRNIRSRGAAVNEREFMDDRICIAVPIQTAQKGGCLALSISLPATKIDARSVDRLIDKVKQTSIRISRILDGHSHDAGKDLPFDGRGRLPRALRPNVSSQDVRRST